MKKILKIIEYIFISILAVIAILIGIVVVQTIVAPDKIPTLFGYKPFVVLSGSMETEIYEGDLAIVKTVDTSTLKKGDIIAFKDSENYVVTHRIDEVLNENGATKYITKGDNNNTQDSGYVLDENIEGIYIGKISGFGNVILVMQKPVTLVVTLLIIVLGGTVIILIGNNKLSSDERKELEEFRKQKSSNK